MDSAEIHRRFLGELRREGYKAYYDAHDAVLLGSHHDDPDLGGCGKMPGMLAGTRRPMTMDSGGRAGTPARRPHGTGNGGGRVRTPLWERVSPRQLRLDLACELSVRDLRLKYGCTKQELYATITRFGLWRIGQTYQDSGAALLEEGAAG